ncbi:hypothetical protein [Bacillus pumilus]|uniref:hypothetical protein n=1 Tax=Bacillus pumilus TaxID=1408 RepID=UPI0011A3D109|nr:hypothetical protein [Bacillus pumilus]
MNPFHFNKKSQVSNPEKIVNLTSPVFGSNIKINISVTALTEETAYQNEPAVKEIEKNAIKEILDDFFKMDVLVELEDTINERIDEDVKADKERWSTLESRGWDRTEETYVLV